MSPSQYFATFLAEVKTGLHSRPAHDIGVILSMAIPLIGLIWAIVALIVHYSHYPAMMTTAVICFWFRDQLMISAISLGFHRGGTHNGFKTHKWVWFFLIANACTTLQGTPVKWIGKHSVHHSHSDEDGDPHSPHDRRWVTGLRQFFHAYNWWFFTDTESEEFKKFAEGLNKNQIFRIFSKPLPYFSCVFIGALIPTLIVGFVTAVYYGWEMFGTGCLMGFLIGGLAPICRVNHSTYCVNSVCHLWGYKNFKKGKDRSVNNRWVAFLTWGEGFHSNHHEWQRSVFHALFSKEFWLDMSGLVVRCIIWMQEKIQTQQWGKNFWLIWDVWVYDYRLDKQIKLAPRKTAPAT